MLLLVFLVLTEIKKNRQRHSSEEMFRANVFNQKVQELKLSAKEVKVLELLVRYSRFFNEDAIFNSPLLFEEAVHNYYADESLERIPEDTLALITSLRGKLGYHGLDIDFTLVSTRQYPDLHAVKLVNKKEGFSEMSFISRKSERHFVVYYPELQIPPENWVGKNIRVILTRQGDAVYSARVRVLGLDGRNLVLSHTEELEKQQLRRWVRQEVQFPVEVELLEGTQVDGFLEDLSAGGILLVLPASCESQTFMRLRFELPGFGVEEVLVKVLHVFKRKKEGFPGHFLYSASFEGEFGRVQEDILQYIFEERKRQNRVPKAPENEAN